MTNYNFTGKEISKKLDDKTIQKGGMKIITLPNAKVSNNTVDKKTEFGGYLSIINYNKEREEQFKKDRSDKSLRRLRKHLKQMKLRNSGLTFCEQTCVEGDFNS